jgi:hypothetical protein
MKQKIIENINDPLTLEKLYRGNSKEFSRKFIEISSNYNSDLVRFWKLRLAPGKEIFHNESRKHELLVVVILSCINGLLVLIPALFTGINKQTFYLRNLSIIVFNGIILYTFWKNSIFYKWKIFIYGLIVVVLLLYANFLPSVKSDSVNLSLIHIPLFLWCLFGMSFVSFDFKNMAKRIEFVRFNGELLIMTGLILIAGGLLTAMTLGLFSAIKINIEDLYIQYVVIPGCAVAPLVSYYLIKVYPDITSRISPVISRVFTPLVLVTLFIYLVSLIFSNTNFFEDRDLLLLLNIMLFAVVAIIVFSITELDKSKVRNSNILILFVLAVLAIVINTIVIIAIITRVLNGFTPNRTVVLISNILIFSNLILIANNLFRSYLAVDKLESVELTVANYLTVYTIWTLVVIFIFPFVFGFN